VGRGPALSNPHRSQYGESRTVLPLLSASRTGIRHRMCPTEFSLRTLNACAPPIRQSLPFPRKAKLACPSSPGPQRTVSGGCLWASTLRTSSRRGEPSSASTLAKCA